jgi:hypothetical protein
MESELSLIAFHKVLIATAILFSLGLAAWALSNFATSGDIANLLLAVGSGMSALVLIVYLRHLRRFLKL